MQYHNALEPNEEQVTGFLAPGDDQPIYMLNLLKYKDRAEYADGRETDLSGPEYQAIAVRREAGLAGQLNIETHAQFALSMS
jgi:hypothetical protein